MKCRSSTVTACVKKLKVLAEPTRLTVLRALQEGEKGVKELAVQLKIEQSLLSHHLQTLRRAGLVTSWRKGRGSQYQLAPGIACHRRHGLQLGCCLLLFEGEPC